MANRNQQQRGGQQHYQGRNTYPSGNQMGGAGQGGGYDQQSAYQANHGQYGGSYGADTNYQRPPQFGNYELQGNYRGHGDHYGGRVGSDNTIDALSDNPNFSGQMHGEQNFNAYEQNATDHWLRENSRGPRGYGHSQSYRGQMGHVDDMQRSGYGPVGHEANFDGGYHPHDPDYWQWRAEKIRGLDNDYRAWREERYNHFSNEFGEWRKNRKEKSQSAGSRDAGDTESASGSSHGSSAKSK